MLQVTNKIECQGYQTTSLYHIYYATTTCYFDLTQALTYSTSDCPNFSSALIYLENVWSLSLGETKVERNQRRTVLLNSEIINLLKQQTDFLNLLQ